MRVAAVLTAIAFVLLVGSPAAHSIDQQDRGGCTTATDDSGYELECSTPGSRGGAEEPGPAPEPRGPQCTTRGLRPEEFFGTITLPLEDGTTYVRLEDGSLGRRLPSGQTQRATLRSCDDGTQSLRWVDTGVTVQDLIAAATARARRDLPAPTPTMSPAPEVGGVVNLGLWLAIADQTPEPISARAGGLWATATASVVQVTWSMGDGTTVVCDGLGVPIEQVHPDGDTVEQGPCGHTYLQSSADDTPYQINVTATWSIDYTSSAGAGTAGTIDRTSTFAYDVDEIQTVGSD